MRIYHSSSGIGDISFEQLQRSIFEKEQEVVELKKQLQEMEQHNKQISYDDLCMYSDGSWNSSYPNSAKSSIPSTPITQSKNKDTESSPSPSQPESPSTKSRSFFSRSMSLISLSNLLKKMRSPSKAEEKPEPSEYSRRRQTIEEDQLMVIKSFEREQVAKSPSIKCGTFSHFYFPGCFDEKSKNEEPIAPPVQEQFLYRYDDIISGKVIVSDLEHVERYLDDASCLDIFGVPRRWLDYLSSDEIYGRKKRYFLLPSHLRVLQSQ